MSLSFWNNTKNGFKIAAINAKKLNFVDINNPGDKLTTYHNFYCSLVVWTCIDQLRIWLWQPLNPRFQGPTLLPPHPQSIVFHKMSMEIELMLLLSNKHLDFIENLKHSFHNFVFLSTSLLHLIWKALRISRELGPMVIFLWPLSTKCLSNFSNTFQFVLGSSTASWRNLLSSKPV